MSKGLYREIQENRFNTFPRRSSYYIQCILCKKQFKVTEIDHICTMRSVNITDVNKVSCDR